MQTEFSKWATKREAEGKKELARRIRMEGRIAAALVVAGLALGYSVSVHNGEEWVVRRSTKRAEILQELFTTGGDTLAFRDQQGALVGKFFLVYGSSGYDVIADYTANDASEALYKNVEPLIEKLELQA